MKKEDILLKTKYGGLDEREANIFLRSFGIGGIVVCILAVVFSVWEVIHGKTFFEFSSLIFAYLCATDFYMYKNIKNKRYLIIGIFFGILTIALIIMFFARG